MSAKVAGDGAAGSLPKVMLVSARADLGGGPEHIHQLVRGLKGQVDFHCALPRQEPFFRKMEEEGLGLVELPVRKFGVGPLRRLREYVRANEIGIVHSHGRGAGFYSRGLRMMSLMSHGTAVVHTFHGIHWRSGSLANLVEQRLSRLTDVAICVSSSERATGERLGLMPRQGLRVIENGIQEATPRPDPLWTPDCDRPFVIGTLCRFHAVKNIPYALTHLAQYLRRGVARYRIGGDGEQRQEIEAMVRALGLTAHVEIPGFIADRDAFFNEIDVYLSTSVGEAFGLSVAEAMGRGIPVVASRVRGSMDVVEDGLTGFLFDLTCPAEMVRTLERLCQDGALYRRMSEAAIRRTRERFSVKRMCDQVLEVYRTVQPCA